MKADERRERTRLVTGIVRRVVGDVPAARLAPGRSGGGRHVGPIRGISGRAQVRQSDAKPAAAGPVGHLAFLRVLADVDTWLGPVIRTGSGVCIARSSSVWRPVVRSAGSGSATT